MYYFKDPKTGERSVSLTLVAVTFIIAVVAMGLQVAKVTDNISSVLELFYATAALYFSRRWNGTAKSIDEKVE